VTGVAGQVAVAGVGYSQIGRDTGRTEGDLATEACLAALADAGLEPDDVDGLTTYPDRHGDPFEGPSLPYVQHALGLRNLAWWQAMGRGPAQFAPVIGGIYAIAGGGASVVLAFRAHRRQTRRYYAPGFGGGREAPDELAFRAPYGAPGGAPRLALWATRHMHEYGTTEEQLGSVVLTCREHARHNPRAVWRDFPLTMDDYLASPMVASPFRRLDCDYPVDGAVAVVLVGGGRAAGLGRPPVWVEAVAHAPGPTLEWELWPDLTHMASRYVGQRLWSATCLRPGDVDVVEVYDGFSWLALCWLEDLGFCAKGQAGSFVAEGRARLGGDLPICTDGGQLGAGRLHGFGKLAAAVLQLRGEAGAAQVTDAEVALACAGGGSAAAALLLKR